MSFLFGQPNSVERAPTRKLLLCGVGLTVCGIATVLNGAIASSLEAEKTYHLEHFTNTHWITSVFLFAGIAAVLVDRTKINAFLLMTVALCCVSVSIGLIALVADCINIYIVSNVDIGVKSYTALTQLQLDAMITYSYVDMVTCTVSTGLSLTILAIVWRISSRFFADVPEFKSPGLLVLGIAMVAVAFGKGVLWLIEILWLKSLGDQARFLFLHYTIDEPVWNAINYTIGALIMMVATKGTRVLMYVTLGLASLSAYPTLIYLWIDYRWYSNVKMSELTVHLPKPPNVLVPNMILGVIHLALLLTTIVYQLRIIHKAGTQLFKVVIEADQMLRQAVVYGGLMLILAGCVMTVSDIANLVSKTFYRVFYPTEQKLPFSLFVAGPLCLLALHRRMSLYFLPTAFAVLIFTAHTSIFMVVAYFYLAYNTYFSDQLCELFHFGKRHCETQLERLGSWSHFIEATLSACIFMMSIYLAFVLGRLMKLHKLRMTDLSLDEMRKKRSCEICIKMIGWVFLAVGVTVLLCSMLMQANVFSNSPHPLLTLHSTVYRSCLAVALIAYPIVQVATAHDILFYPLRSIALCVISLVRFVDILTQLDYRNVGQDTGFAWALFSLVELLSLAAHFATICCCVTLLDLALNRVPRFDFGEPPDAISNGGHGGRLEIEIKEAEPVGYRQLQTNDEYGDSL